MAPTTRYIQKNRQNAINDYIASFGNDTNLVNLFDKFCQNGAYKHYNFYELRSAFIDYISHTTKPTQTPEFQKPEIYRDFIVYGNDAKKRLDDFYDWLGEPVSHTNTTNPTKPLTQTTSGPVRDITKERQEQEEIVRSLFEQNQECLDKKQYKYFYTVRQKVCRAVIKLFSLLLDEMNQKEMGASRREFWVFVQQPILIRYITVLTFDTKYEHLIRAIVRKTLELLKYEGIAECIYLLAKLCPDLVSKECYPQVTIKKEEYLTETYRAKILAIPEYNSMNISIPNIF